MSYGPRYRPLKPYTGRVSKKTKSPTAGMKARGRFQMMKTDERATQDINRRLKKK